MSDTAAALASVALKKERKRERERVRYLALTATERSDRTAQILDARKKRAASLTSEEINGGASCERERGYEEK